MSDQQPPAGGPSYTGPASGSSPDYGGHRNDLPQPPADSVTLGGGAWNDPSGNGRRRTWWYVGGGAVAAIALVAGGTVFAATHLGHQRDPGPAAGLPGDTLAYAAVDLDPSAGQKIEAIKALRAFPAFTHGIKLDPDSDLRKLLLKDELTSEGCSLDWDEDVAPWLGNDVGAAMVPASGGAEPVAILAVQDEDAATKDLPKLLDCASAPHGLSISDGWAVIAKSDSVAQSVTKSAADASLADDADFKTWTERTGDPGVATFYASKDAGATLAGYLDTMTTRLKGPGTGTADSSFGSASAAAPAAYSSELTVSYDDVVSPDPLGTLLDICPAAASGTGPAAPDLSQLRMEKQQLSRMQGGAATLRFAHSGFELESAAGVSGQKAADGAGDTGLQTLPDDTAFAFGAAPGTDQIDLAVTSFAQGFAQQCGSTPAKVLGAITKLTGLSLPADLDTLLGRGVTFAASGSIDPEALANSTDPSDLAAGLKLQGDPQQLTGVLQKLTVPGAQQLLATTSGDDVVAVGPDADYRAQLVKHGSLGKSAAFTDVIPRADQATAAFFVSFDNLRTIFDSAAAHLPAEARDNLAHLRAFGASSWPDDGFTHGLVRLSTQ